MSLVFCDCCAGVIYGEFKGPPHSLAELFRLDVRIRDKIEADAEGGCWIWTGAQQKSGSKGQNVYGRLRRAGALWLVHRWVYRLMIGRIEDGHDVHHQCNETLCCNPAHLEQLEAGYHAWLHNEEDSCNAV